MSTAEKVISFSPELLGPRRSVRIPMFVFSSWISWTPLRQSS